MEPLTHSDAKPVDECAYASRLLLKVRIRVKLRIRIDTVLTKRDDSLATRYGSLTKRRLRCFEPW